MPKIFRPIGLTRDQLANFLLNAEQIKQFENLFALAETVVDDPDNIVIIDIEAGSAQSSANDALAQLVALAQESAISSALAENRANEALALVDKLTKAVEGLQMTPPPREFKRARFGSFLDTTTQVATVINTATAITFNTTDISQGVFIGSPTSRIVVDSEGLYNFAISFQIDKTSGGTAQFFIFFRVNGVDVPDSAGLIRIQGNNAEIFSAYNIFLQLKANDFVEVMFSVDDLSAELHAIAALAPVPSIPSIILTVNNNIEGVL